MKKSTKLACIILFLAVIFSVPIVQTAYEYRTNPDRCIQMLDLPTDLFVTPLAKAKALETGADSLVRTLGLLTDELKTAGAGDTARFADMTTAAGLCDDALFRVSLLKTTVVDYNRHVTGAANRFAAKDTLSPLYAAFVKVNRSVADIAALIQADSPGHDALKKNARQLESAAIDLKKHSRRVGYPALTLTAFRRIMVGSNYLRPYETEMEKSSVFATTVRPWILLGFYKTFGDPGSKGVNGRNDWLFYRPDVDYLVRPDVFDQRSRIVDANDVPVNEDIIGAIVDFKEQLGARGIDLLFVIMPGKPSVYPDSLARSASPVHAGLKGNSQKMILRLRKAGIETVDLFYPLARERAHDRSAGDALYLRTDTHFKGRAVSTVARTVAARVKQYPWYTEGTTEFSFDTLRVARYGDIGEMTGLPSKFMAYHSGLFSAETTDCYQVYRIERGSEGAVVSKALYKDDYRTSKILVLGDSFSRIYQTDQPKSAGWIALLAAELHEPVASMVNDGGASTLVREALARKPSLLRNKKLVIWEVVERDFRFGAEGWKKLRIAE